MQYPNRRRQRSCTYNANAAIVEADKAAVQQYSALVSFEKVYAPFDGVITGAQHRYRRPNHSGSTSSVKTDLFHIAHPDGCAFT